MSDDALDEFRRALRQADTTEQVLSTAHALMPAESGEKMPDAPDPGHSDAFVAALSIELLTRLFAGIAEQVVEPLPEVLGSFPPAVRQQIEGIADDHGIPDFPIREATYLRTILTRSDPTQAELHAAVACMAIVGRYLSAPAEVIVDVDERYDGYRVVLSAAIDRVKRESMRAIATRPRKGKLPPGADLLRERDDLIASGKTTRDAHSLLYGRYPEVNPDAIRRKIKRAEKSDT